MSLLLGQKPVPRGSHYKHASLFHRNYYFFSLQLTILLASHKAIFYWAPLSLSLFLSLKDFIYLFLEKGRKKERERNISVWLPLVYPHLGTWPTIQGCALTGNWPGLLIKFLKWLSDSSVWPALSLGSASGNLTFSFSWRNKPLLSSFTALNSWWWCSPHFF